MKLLTILAIKIIQGLLWLLDRDHREEFEILDDVKKFTHIHPVQHRSDFGTAESVFRTVPYRVWKMKTTSHTLYAADKHLVINDRNEAQHLHTFRVGDVVLTDAGLEEVVEIRDMGIRTHMYCLDINAPAPHEHLYYTDGILSHNTTCAAAFLLWKATFMENFTILITANKLNQAMEIVTRIKESYEELPNWLKAGVQVYNKAEVVFDNGSRIKARATTPDAGRGLSISLLYCLDGESTVTVRDKETGDVEVLSLEDLHDRLSS